MDRNRLVLQLDKQALKMWDVIVIGGGATGLGIALDSLTRGYSTLLLEQSDFSKGTSSRSTKLIHGGVRYLAQGDVFLVMEALHERGLMLKNAPHLTANQDFIIPAYKWRDVVLYFVGLKFYDLLSGRLSMGKSYFIGRRKTLQRLPALNPAGLLGGIVYHDGQFDDSRMALAIAGACIDNGGIVLNYFRITSLLKNAEGNITGVKAEDIISGKEYSLNARVVINATGVFADEIHRMDDPGSRPTIRPSQGVHIVFDNTFLNSSSALMIPKTDDGRVLFAIPWYGKMVVGTTDTPLDMISEEPVALDEEVEFILRTAGKYLARKPEKDDIRCIFAGLRPLAADPDNPSSTKEVSRRHKITLYPSGLLSIIGGKWTSYRRMAEETIDKAIKADFLPERKCVTRDLKFFPDGKPSTGDRLKIYGEGAAEIQSMIEDDISAGELLHERLPYTKAEIAWISRNEMPVTLEDMLARRTRSLFLDVRASQEAAPMAAKIMAREMDFDEEWQQKQVAEYNLLIKNYL